MIANIAVESNAECSHFAKLIYFILPLLSYINVISLTGLSFRGGM